MSKTILFKTSTHTAPNCETHAYNSNFYIKKDYPMFTVKRSGYIILSCIKPQHWMSYKLFANVSWFCCVRGNFHRPCVLHPACVLVRVLRSVDLWCLRSPFLSLFHIYQAKTAAYFREAHAKVCSTVLTVAILAQGKFPAQVVLTCPNGPRVRSWSFLSQVRVLAKFFDAWTSPFLRRRPYRVECTGSLSTSEVKQHRARLVLGWGTAWEDLRVLSASFHFLDSELALSA